MDPRAFAVACVLIASAGCTGAGTEAFAPPGGREDAAGNVSDHADPLVEGAAPAGTPATRALVLTVSALNLTGKIPLRVDFRANLTGADDAGNWTADFGDGTEALMGHGKPTTFNHTFTNAGIFLVIVAAKAVDGATAATNMTIEALPSGPPRGTVLTRLTTHQTGTILLSGAEADCDFDSIDFTWPVPDAIDGVAAIVSHFNVKLVSGPTAIDYDLYLYDPNGKLIKDAASLGAAETISVDGAWDAGDYRIHVAACLGVAGDVTVDGEAVMAAA